MRPCFFTSDLHGSLHRYRQLVLAIEEEAPSAVLLGGDLFPSILSPWHGPEGAREDFLSGFLVPEVRALRARMGPRFPSILLILGNDDPRDREDEVRAAEGEGLWRYVHGGRYALGPHPVFGYPYVPPTPFLWKDWERYDVSRYVPPGCVSPEEGCRSVKVSPHEIRYRTIKDDLGSLAGAADLSGAVLLFHTPPADTALDRAALDGRVVDHVPLDLHVGSVAVRRFIEARQPLLTLHGHIHESARIMGTWRDRIGRTHLFTGAHDGRELALVRFDPRNLEAASRSLL